MEFATKCLHAGYQPKNGEAGALPIYQSTTFKYDSTEQVAKLFDLQAAGFFYSRLANPTVDAVEQKIAALEGGVGAICTSSGQAAWMVALLNICQSGDHIVACNNLYGGTTNLIAVTLKRFGIEVSFIDETKSNEELSSYFKPNTKALVAETISNPCTKVLDIERIAKLAHDNGVPLLVDNTFATPYLCRPIEFGADIVVHSTTKYMDGHALGLGGAIVDSGNFDWAAHKDKFAEFSEPDASYHGSVYTEAFGKAAYIVKARVQLIRDLGCLQSPQNAFYVNQGLETLPLRMDRHSANALKVAEFLSNHPKVEQVFYPLLANSSELALANKYLPKGASGVLSFKLKGTKDDCSQFVDKLDLINVKVHVADIKTIVLHPASSSHRQLTDEQLAQAGISPNLIRLSVGLEDVNDIIADLSSALAQLGYVWLNFAFFYSLLTIITKLCNFSAPGLVRRVQVLFSFVAKEVWPITPYGFFIKLAYP